MESLLQLLQFQLLILSTLPNQPPRQQIMFAE